MGDLIDLLPLPYPDAVVAVGATLLGLVAGALGCLAVLRGRSLVSDALAHSALPGVCVAFLLTGTKDVAALLAGAAVAGLVAALVMVAVERSSRLPADATIAVVLSCFFSAGIVLLTHIGSLPDADQAGLERFIFGQAAALSAADVTVTVVVGGLALGFVVVARHALKATLFDTDFAAANGLPVRALEVAITGLLVAAIVVGLRTVGAVLMVALLVAPAVAARQLVGTLRAMLAVAGALGAAIGLAGALLSEQTETPTGPVVVLVGFAVAVASVLLAPGRGALWRTLARRRSPA